MTEPVDSSDALSCEAEYNLETPARCPSCHVDITTLQVVRMLRGRVNFTSTLPRRGQMIVCPACRAVISASLSAL